MATLSASKHITNKLPIIKTIIFGCDVSALANNNTTLIKPAWLNANAPTRTKDNEFVKKLKRISNNSKKDSTKNIPFEPSIKCCFLLTRLVNGSLRKIANKGIPKQKTKIHVAGNLCPKKNKTTHNITKE